MLEAKAKDQGHRRKCSAKKGLQTFFQASKFFSGDLQNFNNSKNTGVVEPRRDLRLRGQGQGLDLRGQGHQNVSSRTPPLFNTALLLLTASPTSSFCCQSEQPDPN